MLFHDAIAKASRTGGVIAHPSATSRVFIFVPGREIVPSFDPLLSTLGADARVSSADHVDTLVAYNGGEHFELLVGSSAFIEPLVEDWGWFFLTEAQLENFRSEGDWNV